MSNDDSSKKKIKDKTLFYSIIGLIVLFVFAGFEKPETKNQAEKTIPEMQISIENKERYISTIANNLNGKLGVSKSDLDVKINPKGQGVFVYVPQTRFNGVSRYLLWLVIDDQGFALNGASKNLTPDLKWPREALDIYKKSGVDPYSPSEQLDIVFKTEAPHYHSNKAAQLDKNDAGLDNANFEELKKVLDELDLDYKVPEVVERFSEEKRKIIFREMILAECKAEKETKQQYPLRELRKKYVQEVLDKYNLTDSEKISITDEAIKKMSTEGDFGAASCQ